MNPTKSIMDALKGAPMILCMLLAMTLAGCNEEAKDINDITKQTVLVYMPWSGSTNSTGLLSAFRANIDSIESGIRSAKGLGTTRALLFLSETASSSTLYEFLYDETTDKCTRQELKTYTGHDFSTAEGITAVLEDMKSFAPALNYAMMVGCHGTGWTYIDSWERYPYYAKPAGSSFDDSLDPSGTRAYHAGSGSDPATRFYGSVEDMRSYSTDISTLAQAIEDADIRLQYIMFDDCYMANVEVAYELRNVTNFLIASTCEVMNVGFPYQTMWSHLAKWQPNYASAVSAFKTFYESYVYPYGTVAAIDCRKMDELAATMKLINQKYTFDTTLLDNIQALDGFKTHIFYDIADYANNLCTERALINRFESALENVVVSKANTDEFYTNLYGSGYSVPIGTFSGLTTSDPSQNSVVLKSIQRTAWYSATH